MKENVKTEIGNVNIQETFRGFMHYLNEIGKDGTVIFPIDERLEDYILIRHYEKFEHLTNAQFDELYDAVMEEMRKICHAVWDASEALAGH